MVESCRRYLIALLALALSSFSLHAQRPGEAPPERNLKVRFYAYGSGSFAGIHFAPKPGDSEELILYPGSATETFDYRGPPTLQLFRETVRPGMPPLRSPIGEVPIADGLREVFVLVVKLAGSEDTYRLFACDDSLGGLPENHLAFLNLTGANLEGLVGETPVELSAGLSEPFSVEPYFGQRAVLVGLTVRYEDTHRIVLENRTRFYPGRRTLVVLLPPEKEGSFDVVAFKIQDIVGARQEAPTLPRP